MEHSGHRAGSYLFYSLDHRCRRGSPQLLSTLTSSLYFANVSKDLRFYIPGVMTQVLTIFSERELMFMFAICRRPSVCRLSVTFAHPTQAIEIFGNVSMPFGTSAICDPSVKILQRSSQGNPSVGGLNQRRVEKCSYFGHFQRYISETVQDRR